MKGQWIGKYDGDVTGDVMINIDEVDDHFEATAYIRPSSSGTPASVAYLDLEKGKPTQTITAYINPIDPRNGNQTDWESIKNLFPADTAHSRKAETTIELKEDALHVSALTDIGVTFKSDIKKPALLDGSKVLGEKLSWSEFKVEISRLSKFDNIFRGQAKPWNLCTSFHRRGRFRISEFIKKDVTQLHQRLCAITNHYFDLTKPDQNGAFFNLLQHHGYPTPLLDWTYSPYVSAFFAFRERPIGYTGNEYVRIYVFNKMNWMKNFLQIQNADPPFPHLSVMEFIAIGNPRLVPQQAVTTVTNVHDVEAYILQKESETGLNFIRAIDIPARERETAMQDLRFMGITAGSMFPGIDGVCEELKERNF